VKTLLLSEGTCQVKIILHNLRVQDVMLRVCARSDSLKSKSTFSRVTIREIDVNLTRAKSRGLLIH